MRLTHTFVLASAVSGAAGLMHETIWSRAMSLVAGSTVEATAVTFAAFMGGMGIGGFLGGALSRRRNVWWAYAVIEGLAAVLAPLIGVWLTMKADAISSAFAEIGLQGLAAFLPAALLLALPAVFLGATLPLLVTIARQAGNGLDAVGWIYGANILGGAAGALFTAYHAIPVHGIALAAAIAGLFNLVSGGVVLLSKQAATTGNKIASPSPDMRPSGSGEPLPLLLAAAALSGAAVFAMEMVWARHAAFFIGNRSYATAVLLSAVLILLALGAWAAAWLERRGARPRAVLCVSSATAAIGILAADTGLRWLWGAQDSLEGVVASGIVSLELLRYLEAVVLMAPVFVPLGVMLPITITAAVTRTRGAGASTGLFYLVNTLGAIAGVLLAGLLGLGTIGANGVSALVVVATGLFGAALLAGMRGSGDPARFRLAPAVAMTVCVAALGAAAFERGPLLAKPDMELVHVEEGRYGVLQVYEYDDDLCLEQTCRVMYMNNTSVVHIAGAPTTHYAQQMQAHLGVAARPRTETALVIGAGFGITAGALAEMPRMGRVDVVEVAPSVVRSGELFRPHNFGYTDHPDINVIVDDGRHVLAASQTRYGVISANPTRPEVPQGAALFHTDFYDLVKARLKDDGVFVQFVYGPASPIIVETLQTSFDHVRLFPVYDKAYVALATDDPVAYDHARLREIYADPAMATILRRIPLPDADVPDLLSDLKRPSEIRWFRYASARPATDNQPRTEFSGFGYRTMLRAE